MNATKIIRGTIALMIAIPIVYGAKHIAHKQCVRGALEMRCKHFSDCRGVEDIEVPWWNPTSDGYQCAAKLKVLGQDGNEKISDFTFTAKRVGINDAVGDVAKALHNDDVADDWEVNMGFWGWIGDDYRIQDLKAK